MPRRRSAPQPIDIPVASVIIPHWGTVEALTTLLEKLLSQSDNDAPGAPLQVIVVHNANPKKLPAALLQRFPAVHWVLNQQNKGFAAAANQGALLARSDWLLFLNPDCHLTPADIGALELFATRQHLAATSPTHHSVTYHQPLPSFASLFALYSPLRWLLPLSLFHKTTLPGGSLLIQRHVLQALGGWDERFFVWSEDSDLSLRLAKNNFAFDVCPEVTVEHEGGASFQGIGDETRRALFFGSLAQLSQKHFHQITNFLIQQLITQRLGAQLLLPEDLSIRASIVVPNLHSNRALEFLEKNVTRFELGQDELIIVSGDPTTLKLKATYPAVIFIYEPNQGFAHAVNTGFRRGRGKWLGTINDDTELPTRWVSKLLENDDGKVGSIAPVVLKPNREVESAGIRVLPQGKAHVFPSPPKQTEIDANNAAAVLYRRAALLDCGLLNEAFGSYLEDIELGLRLRRARWQHRVVANVSVIHFGQQTSGQFGEYKALHDVKNWWRIVLTQFPSSHWQRYWQAILTERARNFSGLLKVLWRIDDEKNS